MRTVGVFSALQSKESFLSFLAQTRREILTHNLQAKPGSSGGLLPSSAAKAEACAGAFVHSHPASEGFTHPNAPRLHQAAHGTNGLSLKDQSSLLHMSVPGYSLSLESVKYKLL